MKGIILAGGNATRLRPITHVVSKQLLPIYDKPMIYYPLSTLMLSKIREVLIICKPEDYLLFKNLFGDGSFIGMSIKYAIQVEANGLAQALVLGEQFVAGDSCALILGDNLFHGEKLVPILHEARESVESENKTIVFGIQVAKTQDFGIIEFDESGKAISLIEKPKHSTSNFAVPGLYFYPSDACGKAKSLKPSARNEYEITDLNKVFMNEGRLFVKNISDLCEWFDTGSIEDYLKAIKYVSENEKRTKIAYIEEIAYKNGWINKQQLFDCAKKCKKSPYGEYLIQCAEDSASDVTRTKNTGISPNGSKRKRENNDPKMQLGMDL